MQAQRFSWSRRIGVAVGLLLLVGAGIAFAGNALNGSGRGNGASPAPAATRAASKPDASPSPDTRAPVIHISRPDGGSVVYGPTETLRGRTEPGASLTVTDETVASEVEATVEPDGTFHAELPLQLGTNRFMLSSEDVAGNRASARLEVTRATSLGSAVLSLSATDLELAALPTTINATAVVVDENGNPSTDAEAVFSLSPPNGSTQTYETTTADGQARWVDMVLAGERRGAGKWLVTVLVTLPSGERLRDDAFLTVR